MLMESLDGAEGGSVDPNKSVICHTDTRYRFGSYDSAAHCDPYRTRVRNVIVDLFFFFVLHF